ncbi:leucine-rich repeat-containing protein 14 [Aplysia californica]|uniref:Leucine-rich repeat-containing protein 14 n=1 Tax=Aplysia californica TaxID=6500 RepID=A0ABM0JFD6_APLCA|nr:leucine-rich repeat-containing protein 14 [Aplysia californica]
MAGAPMQGSQCLWYDHYKGSLFPLDLDAPPSCEQNRTSTSSLLEICCSYVVKDAAMTRAAIDCVPSILRVHMMEAALKGNHDRSIQALMSRWSLQSLVLSRLVPSVFTSLLPLYRPVYQSDLVRQGLRYTTALAHTFLECLRQVSSTKIRHLDITGFPTAEVILYYLCSHCMLAHNERRRNNMITLYNQALHLAQECHGSTPDSHSPLDTYFQNCLPENISVEIKLDAFVTSESCHSELCKALTVSAFPETRFRLVVERLSITCLGGERVLLLLKQLRPEEIRGLQLKYNSLENSHLLLMAPTLQSLTQLTALDLSCNHLNLYQASSALILQQVFAPLVHLRRLDLSNNRLKNQLATILSGISHPLQQLCLAACGLTPADVGALATCPHTLSLEELDLSENSLTPCYVSLGRILANISSCVKVLELENCRFTDEIVMSLTIHFSGFQNLLFLSLAGNTWTTSTVLTLTKGVAKLKKLKVLQLSYPYECHTDEASSEELELFKATVASLLEADDLLHTRPNKVELVLF